MEERTRRKRSPLRSFALGATVGAAGTIATLRGLRRGRVTAVSGLAAFEDAPCFRELARGGGEPPPQG